MVKRGRQAQKLVIVGDGVSSHGLTEPDHVSSSFSRHPSLLPQPHTKMSVSLNPSSSLGFRRPFSSLVKRSLTITNHNSQPVAFKVKTTAPKLYCVRPNSGRVEPWETVEVSVMLQALKEDPPLNTKCKDKFLIQSTIITPEKEALPVQAIWSSPDVNEEGKVHQQKLRVTYLPAEGQTVEEEDENSVAMASMIGDSIHIPFGQLPDANGHPSHIFELTPAPSQQPEERASTPTQDAVERQVSSHTDVQDLPHDEEASYRPQSPIPPLVPTEADTTAESIPEVQDLAPEPAPLPVPAPQHVAQTPITPVPVISTPIMEPLISEPPTTEPLISKPPTTKPPEQHAPAPVIITRENPYNEELFAKYNHAQVEIVRLKEQVASLSELRRRPRALSDDGSTASDIQTIVEESPVHQEGVPLQVVVVIAFGVFIMTYLFF